MLVCLYFLCALEASAQSQDEKINLIFQKLEANYGSIQNGKYQCTEKFKTALAEKDTSTSNYEITFQKPKKDNFRLSFPKSAIFWVASGSKAYLVYNNTKEVTVFKKKKWLGYVRTCEESTFLNMENFLSELKRRRENRKNLSFVEDTHPQFIKLVLGNKTLILDKETYKLKKICHTDISKYGTQYKEWEFTYQDFNKAIYEDPMLYGEMAIPQGYEKKSDDYKERSEAHKKTLFAQVGQSATDWQYPTLKGDSIQLSDLKGKVILLDFWYQSCLPCVRAMPFLEKMHNTYKDKGLVVLGLNPFDKKKESLAIFVEKHKLTYPTLLIDVKTASEGYKVWGYPHLFLINREGKIVFIKNGYHQSMNKSLEKEIRKVLEN